MYLSTRIGRILEKRFKLCTRYDTDELCFSGFAARKPPEYQDSVKYLEALAMNLAIP